MKKKTIAAVGIAAYLGLLTAISTGVFDKTEEVPMNMEAAETEVAETEMVEAETELPDSNRDFSIVQNNLEYTGANNEVMYVSTDELKVTDADRKNILNYYKLPALERMSEEDTAEKMANLQVFTKMEILGVDSKLFYNPEYNWKAVYNDSLVGVKEAIDRIQESVSFTGTTASELNRFMQSHQGYRIEVESEHIELDTMIEVPSNIILDGNNAEFSTETPIEYAMHMRNVENVSIQNVRLTGGFARGIYIVESNHVLLYNNEVANATYKGIFVMGTNEYVNLVANYVHDNGWGAVFLQGDISNSIIQHNRIYQNRGTRNLGAGLVLCAVNLTDLYLPYEQEYGIDEYLYNMLDAPHDVVVKDNEIYENYSSGIYSDGAYMNYIIDNVIKDNEKEGICLDFGSFGTYISSNTIDRNGDRNRQSDHDLDKDFVLELGRLEDGSSTAKLPGISLDNAAYNIIFNNVIDGNAGSGVKMVRSGFRNVILCNVINNNNAGENEFYHGFGVELGHAAKPDQAVKGLDFTADYENIVARNVISGHHYSGVYLAEGVYCNDLIDNVILDCKQFSVENFSEYFNSSVGNNTNVGTLNFGL